MLTAEYAEYTEVIFYRRDAEDAEYFLFSASLREIVSRWLAYGRGTHTYIQIVYFIHMIQPRPINVGGAFCILLSCDNSSEALVKHMSHVWLAIVARMVDNCRAYG